MNCVFDIKVTISNNNTMSSTSSINFTNDINIVFIKYVKALSKKYDFDENEAIAYMNLGENIEKTSKDKKTKKTKSKSVEKGGEKKKKVSGYLQFSKEMRESVKEKLGIDTKSTEIMKEVAAQWTQLSDEEKQKWNEKAKEISESSSSDKE